MADIAQLPVAHTHTKGVMWHSVTTGSHVGHAQWHNLYYYSSKKNTREKAGHVLNILPVTSGDFRWLPVTWLTSLPVDPHRSPTNANWAIPIYYSYECQWVTSSYNCYIYIYIYIYILPWHLLGHAIKSVTCFDLQFSHSTRLMTSLCIFTAYISTEGILFNVKITRWN